MLYKKIDIRNPKSQENAYLQLYVLDDSEEFMNGNKRPFILICPGGGYFMVSDREAEPIAMRYCAAGFHVGVLHYSVIPSRYPVQLYELAQSVAYLRKHINELCIDEKAIMINGFSAGGHLAAMYGNVWDTKMFEFVSKDSNDLRVNGLILGYPVITSGKYMNAESIHNLLGDSFDEKKDEVSAEKGIRTNNPPVFIWHTMDDPVVPVKNSIDYLDALHKNKIEVEAIFYEKGGHGLGLANEITQQSKTGFGVEKECQDWIDKAIDWVHRREG